jgi:hypothetical protein
LYSGRDHNRAIARLNGRTQSAHRLLRVLAIVILVVKRQPVQRENVERSLARKRVLNPRSTAVLLEARRRLPERPRRRSWVIGRSSSWLGSQFATRRTSRQRRSAQVNSILIFDLLLERFAFGVIADLMLLIYDVRFSPLSGRSFILLSRPKWAFPFKKLENFLRTNQVVRTVIAPKI